ncbi:MAG: FadR family transcriptional regulator [Deltaproteobacteria bacterium]|nr:FadR family transcriptional regulator [Deltaproteobacteria bacterium]
MPRAGSTIKNHKLTRRKNLFSTVTPSKISDMVYKQLVSLITKGQLKPGERLPSERAMALELGVSRQSIREAIYRAMIAGLMEVRQGEGTFIISSFKGNLRQPLSILLEEEAEKVFEFLEIRKLIEGWCAERACEAATPADLKKMHNIFKKMEKVKPAESAWEKADLDFHASIAVSTHNVLAMHVMDALKDSFHTYFRVKKYNTKPERKGVLLSQHRAILDAITEKKPKRARKKVMEHLDYVEKMITEDILGKR